jgi:hypothetical protein
MKLYATAGATIMAVAHERQNLMKSGAGNANLQPGAGNGKP